MKHLDYEVSSGNVFRDLGLADADELDAKANLAIEIAHIIDRRGLTQVQAAKVLGIDQPKVSAIVRGHLEKFSRDALCDYVRKLGCDVELRITEKKKLAPGRLTVSIG
jgi:predicted XRE-type DNA-binding protein